MVTHQQLLFLCRMTVGNGKKDKIHVISGTDPIRVKIRVKAVFWASKNPRNVEIPEVYMAEKPGFEPGLPSLTLLP